jgi:type IV secretion system protein VirD4
MSWHKNLRDWWGGAPPVTNDPLLGQIQNDGHGFILGRGQSGELVYYGGKGHIVTIAPSRSGKFVSVIAPNMGYYPGSVLAIDPKGEQAAVCGAVREALGQRVFYLNPLKMHGLPCHSFNPMQWLTQDSPRLVTDAVMMAEAMIADDGGEASHWTREARSLLEGLILYVALSPDFPYRDLVTVRSLLTQSEADLNRTLQEMEAFPHENVRAVGAMVLSKSDRERSSVISSVRSQTHYLSVDLMQNVLGASDFDFTDLKPGRNEPYISVFLMLPIDLVKAYSGWLRLMVSMAIKAMLRTMTKPEHQALFVLDEFFSLGHLEDIEIASGSMPGMGLKLHLVVQSLAQLRDKYPKIWTDLISNAGALQSFNASDPDTAAYLSSMVGTSRMGMMDPAREITTAAEVMYRYPGKIMIRVQGKRPFWLDPVVYHRDAEFTRLPYRDNPC